MCSIGFSILFFWPYTIDYEVIEKTTVTNIKASSLDDVFIPSDDVITVFVKIGDRSLTVPLGGRQASISHLLQKLRSHGFNMLSLEELIIIRSAADNSHNRISLTNFSSPDDLRLREFQLKAGDEILVKGTR